MGAQGLQPARKTSLLPRVEIKNTAQFAWAATQAHVQQEQVRVDKQEQEEQALRETVLRLLQKSSSRKQQLEQGVTIHSSSLSDVQASNSHCEGSCSSEAATAAPAACSSNAPHENDDVGTATEASDSEACGSCSLPEGDLSNAQQHACSSAAAAPLLQMWTDLHFSFDSDADGPSSRHQVSSGATSGNGQHHHRRPQHSEQQQHNQQGASLANGASSRPTAPPSGHKSRRAAPLMGSAHRMALAVPPASPRSDAGSIDNSRRTTYEHMSGSLSMRSTVDCKSSVKGDEGADVVSGSGSKHGIAELGRKLQKLRSWSAGDEAGGAKTSAEDALEPLASNLHHVIMYGKAFDGVYPYSEDHVAASGEEGGRMLRAMTAEEAQTWKQAVRAAQAEARVKRQQRLLADCAATIIQAFYRRHRARQLTADLRRCTSLPSDAQRRRAAAAEEERRRQQQAAAEEAAEEVARQRHVVQRSLRREAADVLLALQAQAQYGKTRQRLLWQLKGTAMNKGDGQATATTQAPGMDPMLLDKAMRLGLDPVQSLLQGGMQARHVHMVLLASSTTAAGMKEEAQAALSAALAAAAAAAEADQQQQHHQQQQQQHLRRSSSQQHAGKQQQQQPQPHPPSRQSQDPDGNITPRRRAGITHWDYGADDDASGAPEMRAYVASSGSMPGRPSFQRHSDMGQGAGAAAAAAEGMLMMQELCLASLSAPGEYANNAGPDTPCSSSKVPGDGVHGEAAGAGMLTAEQQQQQQQCRFQRHSWSVTAPAFDAVPEEDEAAADGGDQDGGITDDRAAAEGEGEDMMLLLEGALTQQPRAMTRSVSDGRSSAPALRSDPRAAGAAFGAAAAAEVAASHLPPTPPPALPRAPSKRHGRASWSSGYGPSLSAGAAAGGGVQPQKVLLQQQQQVVLSEGPSARTEAWLRSLAAANAPAPSAAAAAAVPASRPASSRAGPPTTADAATAVAAAARRALQRSSSMLSHALACGGVVVGGNSSRAIMALARQGQACGGTAAAVAPPAALPAPVAAAALRRSLSLDQGKCAQATAGAQPAAAAPAAAMAAASAAPAPAPIARTLSASSSSRGLTPTKPAWNPAASDAPLPPAGCGSSGSGRARRLSNSSSSCSGLLSGASSGTVGRPRSCSVLGAGRQQQAVPAAADGPLGAAVPCLVRAPSARRSQQLRAAAAAAASGGSAAGPTVLQDVFGAAAEAVLARASAPAV